MNESFQVKSYVQEVLNLLKPDAIYGDLIKFYHNQVEIEGFTVAPRGSIHIFGVGKAASFEVMALKKILQSSKMADRLGLCVAYTKREHLCDDKDIIQLEGDHPLLSRQNLEQTETFIKKLGEVKAEDLLILCLSGGGSALLELPVEGVDFEQLQTIHSDLLGSGLNINEMNEVRKALSKVKNGGLLNFIRTDHIIQLITCDIPNAKLEDVSSGPLMPESLDFTKINKYLERFGVRLEVKTPTAARGKTFLAQSAEQLLERLTKDEGRIRGKIYDCELESMLDDMESKLPDMGQALFSGGEATVKVPKGAGLGGRSTHFVLAMADRIYRDPANKNVKILSIGTDGTDGPTDAAGAFIDFEHYDREKATKSLMESDSYNYFDKAGTLIKTGPTMNNLMDIRIVWRE